jgi:hypothetical protein
MAEINLDRVTMGFRVFDQMNMQFKLFGSCEGGRCTKFDGLSCEACSPARDYREKFFEQRFESTMMQKPRLLRRFLSAEPLNVPYLTVYQGYRIVIGHFEDLFNPKCLNLHEKNPEWIPWTKAMEGWREFAYRFFKTGQADYTRQCQEAKDRLELIQAMERRLCACMSIAEYLNEALSKGVGLNDLHNTELGYQMSAIDALTAGWIHVMQSQSLVEVNQETCRADGRDWLIEMENGYNKELQKIKEEAAKGGSEDPADISLERLSLS